MVPQFPSEDAYARSLGDVSVWGPLAEEVLARHDLKASGLRMGDTATFPVVVADERWVIKLFDETSYGVASLPVERDVLALLTRTPVFPAPRLIGAGTLLGNDTGWSWPYLLTTAVPGISLGSVQPRVRDLETTARWLGSHLRALHHLDLAEAVSLTPNWDDFAARLSSQRARCVRMHRQWGLAPRLVAEIDGYVPEAETLLDRGHQPLLLHGDLHAWHIFGTFDAGRFEPHGVIDFGDAVVGDLLYELAPLHIKTFRGDKRLLRAFLDGYGFRRPLDDRFAWRAMCFTLLFEFGELGWVDTSSARSLDDLAAQLWNERDDRTVAIHPPEPDRPVWSIAT